MPHPIPPAAAPGAGAWRAGFHPPPHSRGGDGAPPSNGQAYAQAGTGKRLRCRSHRPGVALVAWSSCYDRHTKDLSAHGMVAKSLDCPVRGSAGDAV